MKKIVTALSSLAVAAAASVTAFAAAPRDVTRIDRSTDPQSADTVLSAEIDPAYILTIPKDVKVEFNALKTDFGTAELTQARLAKGKCVQLRVTADNKMENQTDTSKNLPYRISGETDGSSAEDISLTVCEFTKTGDKLGMFINITQEDWNKAYSGEYSDTVTFEIRYTGSQLGGSIIGSGTGGSDGNG